MSSTERAPEPTMEEILASIRRIITDDETGQAKAPDATSQAKAEDESLEGEADNQIIDDIARVLSGDATETPEAQEEEILDLTAELGGLEIVEDDGDAVFEVEEVAEVLELEEVVVAEVPSEPQAEQLDVEMSVPAPPAQDTTPAPEFAAPPPQEAMTPPPMAAEPPAPPLEPAQSAGEEAASALERAIAALRAGQPTSSTPTPSATPAQPFQFQTAPQPGSIAAAEAAAEASAEPEPVPEPMPMAVPMASPEVEAETHPELESGFEPLGDTDFESQPDVAPIAPMLDEMAEEPAEDLVLTEETEVTVIEEAEMEPEADTPFWPAAAATEEPAPEAEAEFSPQPMFASQSEPEPAPVAAQVNGAEAHHDVAGKTMEDSIKDMLRPMLRQWLDENMPRLIQEGFDPETLRREQD